MMILRRGGEKQGWRGQSTVLGIVLLIGIVSIGSIGLFLVAGGMLFDTEQDSENERVEQAFVELSQQMATASGDDDVSRTVDLDAGASGAVVLSDTGNLRIQGGDVDKNISIGAIEYDGDDGTKIAYQAGGVFRETGNQTRVVSAPPINYDADSETLSFPIIKTLDETHLDSGNVHVSHYDTDPLHNASLVENDSVTIEVTSEYYRGWEAYFERQGGPTTVHDVEVHDDDRGTVTAEFGYLDIDTAFESGISLSGEYNPHPGGDENINMTRENGSFQELDDVIYEMIERENTSENREWADGGPLTITGTDDLAGPESNPNGTYYAEKINLAGDLSVNLSEDNVTLVVKNDITIDNGDLTVEGWGQEGGEDHQLKIYTGGDINIHNGDICPEPCGGTNSSQLQVYGTSNTSLGTDTGGGDRYVEGIFYLASNDYQGGYQVELQASIEFHGAIIANSLNLESQVHGLEYDDTLSDEDIDIYPDGYQLPPQLTYLNVAEHKVTVDGN